MSVEAFFQYTTYIAIPRFYTSIRFICIQLAEYRSEAQSKALSLSQTLRLGDVGDQWEARATLN